MSKNRPDITVVIGSMRIGGAERSTLHLVNGFVKSGLKVELVLLYKVGDFLNELDPHIYVVDLNKRKASQGVGAFRKYLKRSEPKILFVVQNHIQLMVMLAVKTSTWKGKVILNEQSTFSKNLTGLKGAVQRLLSKILFTSADRITTVSEGSAKNLKENFPEMTNKILVIPNAVITDRIFKIKNDPSDHPFFRSDEKVIVSAGRFTRSKNFDLLIKAFRIYTMDTHAKLIILGDGEEMYHLKRLVAALNLKEDVSFPGFVPDPCIYFSKADLFVLSSDYEGLPGVIIEALACGCKVVSTDCDHGPNEILQNGKYGSLCPVGDVNYMADAIRTAIASDVNKDMLVKRANDFHVDNVVNDYLKLFNTI